MASNYELAQDWLSDAHINHTQCTPVDPLEVHYCLARALAYAALAVVDALTHDRTVTVHAPDIDVDPSTLRFNRPGF